MKRKIIGSIIVCVLSLGIVASAASAIKIVIGNELTNIPVKVIKGQIMTPVRTIAEKLGARVDWNNDTNSIIITPKDNTHQDIRIQLLESALTATDPLTAVTRWAEGVKMRNGALQYAMLTPELKKEKYNDFVGFYWSTGVSSPWVESFTITEKGKLDDNTYIYKVEFNYTDSTKTNFKSQSNVIVKKYSKNWFIASFEHIDVAGEITKVTKGDDKKSTSIFVENKTDKTTSYDKATLVINNETKVFKGYTNTLLSENDLKLGMEVEAEFGGPVLMMYPVQGAVKLIRVLE